MDMRHMPKTMHLYEFIIVYIHYGMFEPVYSDFYYCYLFTLWGSSLPVFFFFRWEDAKRAYLKFIYNEIITRHITRNPCTPRYTYSYTLILYKSTSLHTKLQIVT